MVSREQGSWRQAEMVLGVELSAAADGSQPTCSGPRGWTGDVCCSASGGMGGLAVLGWLWLPITAVFMEHRAVQQLARPAAFVFLTEV